MAVDEAHIPLTAKGYCKSLEHFYNIHSEPISLVLLTATLPPSLRPALRETYQLVDDASIHRQATNHAELNFVLKKTSSEKDLVKCGDRAIASEHLAGSRSCIGLCSFHNSVHGLGQTHWLASLCGRQENHE
ncbi:hypothetical protein JVT61DRAFT_24 [Boletus reticuloceps]|uniref:Uncharacterized protein n=1 Tax=Boletus reticuloceps TaxID=495285 RepID=A0A8I3AGF7_9AGAM|nr:hypothetical protein JVT61DRAFT_24 [Boletus reticuloceps]